MPEKLKLDVKDLQLGMYVTEIDRPWLESPFLFQGFLLETQELLQQVSNTCQYVFVDIEQSGRRTQPVLRQLMQTNDTPPAQSRDINTHPDQDYLKLVNQFHCAKTLYKKTLTRIKKMLDTIQLGASIDTDSAMEIVTEMITVVSGHPSAMIWLTYLKDNDDYTSTHSINVCILALSFGHWLGLDREKLHSLGVGAILHDIGKMKVPATIIRKPGKLSDREFTAVKQHSQLGYDTLKNQDYMDEDVLDIVLHHHERIDCSGYPDGLPKEKIRYLTQLVALIDVYAAVTSDSSYRIGLAPHEVLKQLYSKADEHFGKELVEQFIKCLGIYPIGSLVELNRGDVGLVMSVNEKYKLKPSVFLLLDKDKQTLETRKLLNLANPKWTDNPSVQINKILPPASFGIDVQKIISQEFTE